MDIKFFLVVFLVLSFFAFDNDASAPHPIAVANNRNIALNAIAHEGKTSFLLGLTFSLCENRIFFLIATAK